VQEERATFLTIPFTKSGTVPDFVAKMGVPVTKGVTNFV
jgi:hypothetical protein